MEARHDHAGSERALPLVHASYDHKRRPELPIVHAAVPLPKAVVSVGNDDDVRRPALPLVTTARPIVRMDAIVRATEDESKAAAKAAAKAARDEAKAAAKAVQDEAKAADKAAAKAVQDEAKAAAKAVQDEAKAAAKAAQDEAKAAAKAARDEAKAAAKAAQDEAKAAAKAAQDEAKAAAKAAQDEAKAAAKAAQDEAKAADKAAQDEAKAAAKATRDEAKAADKAARDEAKAVIKAAQDEAKAHADLHRNARQLIRDLKPFQKLYHEELRNVACGLIDEDGINRDDIDNLPISNLEGILALNDDHVLRFACKAARAQLERLQHWQTSDGKIVRQGRSGCNEMVTGFLHRKRVTGARTCSEIAPDPNRDGSVMMFHQAIANALYHPLTPIKRSIAIHRTGTGKSFIIANAMEAHFHDLRTKMVLVPTYNVMLGIARDMVTLLPSTSCWQRWHAWWRTWQPLSVTSLPLRSRSYLWCVVAAMSFRQVVDEGDKLAGRQRKAHSDASDHAFEEDAEEDEDERGTREPFMQRDKQRLETLDLMLKGDRPIKDVPNAMHELRAPIVFMTYADHELGFYRDHPAMQRHKKVNGHTHYVSFENAVVFCDEMQNLFDERSRALNRDQRRKVFGDAQKRDRATAKLESASKADVRQRLQDRVRIFTGLSKLLKISKNITLIGTTATPLVDIGGDDGATVALRTLKWIRGEANTSERPSGLRWVSVGSVAPQQSVLLVNEALSEALSTKQVFTTEEWQQFAVAKLARNTAVSAGDTYYVPVDVGPAAGKTQVDMRLYEGYISYFGRKPEALFADADEDSFPNITPILIHMPPELLEAADAEEGDAAGVKELIYGNKRLESLAVKYAIARQAKEWFERVSLEPWFVPTTNGVSVEYLEASKAWDKRYVPQLSASAVRMPQWAEGLHAFGRSPARVGQSVWIKSVDRSTPSLMAWVNSKPTYKTTYAIDADGESTPSATMPLGVGGFVGVGVVATNAPRLVLSAPTRVRLVERDTYALLLCNDGEWVKTRVFEEDVPAKSRVYDMRVTSLKALHDINGAAPTMLPVDVPAEYALLRISVRRTNDVLVFNIPNGVSRNKQVRTELLNYAPDMWFYEHDQLNYDFAEKLDEYITNEAGKWMSAFYGGRTTKHGQANAALGNEARSVDPVPCSRLLQTSQAEDVDGDADVLGYAVDMASTLIPWVMDPAQNVTGKCLWLLREEHGIALVHRWLQCSDSGRRWLKRGQIHVLASYRKSDALRVQNETQDVLEVFNSPDNRDGDKMKLLIGGARDLGTGVTFTELQTIILSIHDDYYDILQQQGRGPRLCKHESLEPQYRRVQYHLPVPVMTTGWQFAAPSEQPAAFQGRLGGMGRVATQIDDFWGVREMNAKRETVVADLHVPPTVLNTLVDLERSRINFQKGMHVFESVAMDVPYLSASGLWSASQSNTRNATAHPQSTHKGTILANLRSMIHARLSTSATPFMQAGQHLLREQSDANVKTNAEIANGVDDVPANVKYRDELQTLLDRPALLEKKRLHREQVAIAQQDKKQRHVAALRSKCAKLRWTGTEWERTDRKPVGQEKALRMLRECADLGFSECARKLQQMSKSSTSSTSSDAKDVIEVP